MKLSRKSCFKNLPYFCNMKIKMVVIFFPFISKYGFLSPEVWATYADNFIQHKLLISEVWTAMFLRQSDLIFLWECVQCIHYLTIFPHLNSDCHLKSNFRKERKKTPLLGTQSNNGRNCNSISDNRLLKLYFSFFLIRYIYR